MVHLKRNMFAFMMLMLFIISGCRGSGGIPTYHMSQDIDFSFYKRVAVMPLDNLTNDKYAGEIVKQVVLSELLASGLVDVVVPGDVVKAVTQLGIKSITSLNSDEIKALGKVLNVDALIIGAVEEYGEIKTGSISAPRVTVTLMMADAGSGTIVWSITKSRGGASFAARHFGASHETISETVLILVRQAIQTLFQY